MNAHILVIPKYSPTIMRIIPLNHFAYKDIFLWMRYITIVDTILPISTRYRTSTFFGNAVNAASPRMTRIASQGTLRAALGRRR